MRISDWSSDVCSSDLRHIALALSVGRRLSMHQWRLGSGKMPGHRIYSASVASVYPFYIAKAEKKGRTKGEVDEIIRRSEEHTSELQSLMRISYAVFCLKKKTKIKKYSSDQHLTTN